MVEKLNLDIPLTKEEEKNKKKSDDTVKKWFKTDKLKKPQQVLVMYLRDNGVAETLILNTKDGMYEVEENVYHTRLHCKHHIQIGKEKIPVHVQRERDIKPLGTAEWEEQSIEEKIAELQNMAIKGIRTAEIVRADGGGKQLDMKTIIIIVGVAIVGLALLQSYL